MILHEQKFLSTKVITLASASPRRSEILKILEINFDINASNFEENLSTHNIKPDEYTILTARGKANEVLSRLNSNGCMVDLVIGADTCVAIEGEILGKPKGKKNAIEMLNKLSDCSHDVFTGVCLKYRTSADEYSTKEFYEKTNVNFAKLSADIIEAYVNSLEPLDKAGGYGIQGLGGSLIKGINGDYYNVMGFPLHHFCSELLDIITEWKKVSA